MKKVNRRTPHLVRKVVREDPDSDENEDEESSEDDEDNGKNKDSRFPAVNYVLIVLVVLFGLSYLYERDMRFQLVEEYNKNIDKAAAELYSGKKEPGAISQVSCPRCPICPGNDAVEFEPEPETPITFEAEQAAQLWISRDQALTGEIQLLSRHLLKLKFGPPPYYIEMEIQVEREDVPGGKVIFEMAPVEYMPYSVYFFLSQVAAGVWDSCSFFLNLGVAYLEDARGGESCKKEPFAIIDGIGEFMAFQEYSYSYRHELDTVGISGRPGGKGFYISVVNNTKPLGPKGDFVPGGPPLQGDPCIGRIVSGQDTLVRMRRIERENENGEKERLFQDINEFQKVVSVKTVRIVPASSVNTKDLA